jgi:hypothetical protein
LGATLVVIFVPLPGAIKLVTLLLLTMTQFSASVWYSLSYIPYGRATALKALKRIVGIEEEPSYASALGFGRNDSGV